MYDIGVWYQKEVQKWRTAACVTWVLLLSPAVAFLVLFFARMTFLQPLGWLTDFVWSALAFSKWFHIGIAGLIFAVLASWNAHFYTVRPPVLPTRLAYLLHVLDIRHILHACGHGLALAIVAWCYTSILNNQYTSLSTSCIPESPVLCLNERHLFLVFHGFYLGLFYAGEFIGHGNNHLQFPIIQQPKFFTIKSNVFNIAVSSVKGCVNKLKYYYVIYYFILGPFCRQWMDNNLDLKTGEDDLGFMGLLSINLFWQVFLSGTWIIFMLNLARLLYIVYQTEPYEFGISAPFDGKTDLCLHKALACSSNPLVQHLAFLDLSLLAKQSYRRRLELYSLSQPGGHPHNWNNVSSACFNTLQLLADRISHFNDKASVASGQARQLSGDKTPLAKFSGDAGYGLKHRKTPVVTLGPDVTSPMKSPSQEESDASKQNLSFLHKITERFKKRKAIAYFSNESPESQSERLFVDVQIHSWTVEALTDLTVSSFNEDKFGVVQKSLPTVIAILLNLQEAVEKFSKLAPGSVRKDNAKIQPGSVLRQSLKTALKTSIYRIVNTFGKHISSVPLSPEHSRRLHQFVEYKE